MVDIDFRDAYKSCFFSYNVFPASCKLCATEGTSLPCQVLVMHDCSEHMLMKRAVEAPAIITWYGKFVVCLFFLHSQLSFFFQQALLIVSCLLLNQGFKNLSKHASYLLTPAGC